MRNHWQPYCLFEKEGQPVKKKGIVSDGRWYEYYGTFGPEALGAILNKVVLSGHLSSIRELADRQYLDSTRPQYHLYLRSSLRLSIGQIQTVIEQMPDYYY